MAIFRAAAVPATLLLSALIGVVVSLQGSAALAGQGGDGKALEAKRPKLALRAQPSVGIAPVRVVLTGELQGGSDDFEEYYCPTVEWEWGDDTSSESTLDCEPYEAGKSQIKRRFTVEHVFRRQGTYKVYFHLKRKDKITGSTSTIIQVQAGMREQ